MSDSVLLVIAGILIGYFILKNFLPKSSIEKVLNDLTKEEMEEQKKIIAWHEVGHALMAKKSNLKVSEITVVPELKGSDKIAYGRTTVHFKNRLKGKKVLEDEIKIFYGGRCAELIFFNYDENLITDGCGGDIEQITLLIKSYINDLGFSKSAGMLNFDLLDYLPDELIEEKINLSKRLEQETIDYLESKKELIEIIVEELMEKNKINEKELDYIIEKYDKKLIDIVEDK